MAPHQRQHLPQHVPLHEACDLLYQYRRVFPLALEELFAPVRMPEEAVAVLVPQHLERTAYLHGMDRSSVALALAVKQH